MLDVNVPDSKKNKFLKLVSISKRWIQDYGFKSFLRTALTEFKKQKFGLFQPNISKIDNLELPKQKLSEFDTYKIWLTKNLNNLNFHGSEENFSNFEYLPFIIFVIRIGKNSNIKNIKETILSITKQKYEKSHLVIYFENTLENILNDEYIKNFEKKPFSKVITNHASDSINDFLVSTEGDFIAFLNAGDILSTRAIFYIIKFLNENQETDLLYTDEDKIVKSGNRTFPFFKPNWSPYLFLSMDYISKFFLIRKKVFQGVGGLRKEFGEEILYDLLLRTTETTKNILHISLPLYSIPENRIIYEETKALTALKQALERRKLVGEIQKGTIANTFRIKYEINNEPKVSIIIPTKDQKNVLKRCIKSLKKKTNYKNLEIIIVDNNSEKEETLAYLDSLPYKIIRYNSPFNFSKINNLAVKNSSGEFLLFLNDDIEALEPNWLKEMVSLCQQNDVGAVGVKLVLSNNTIQHAGMAFLKTGSGFHPFQRRYSHDKGYFGFQNVIRNCSAVTGACLLTKRKVFEHVGGFDDDFDLYYGDSDLCLRIIKAGYQVVYTPYAVLLHEGATKIKEISEGFFAVENHYTFVKKWPDMKKGDPFYNPNLGWNYEIDIKN